MDLREVLDSKRAEIRAGLEQAELELRRLEERRAELIQLMARGRAALGNSVSLPEQGGEMTLHEALDIVLSDNGNTWMTAADLAAEVNRRNLYRMRDGRPVEGSQIHARVRNYSHLFERNGSNIRLRYRFSTSPLDPTGAYWATMTEIQRAEDAAVMYVLTRLAYSVIPPDGQSPAEYLATLSNDRARRLVAKGEFEPDREDVALFTTSGWQQL